MKRTRPLQGWAAVMGACLACAALACGDASQESLAGSGSTAFEVPQARLRVRTEPVRLARLSGGDRVTGTLRAFHRATLMAEVQGRVVSRAVEPGTHVEAGALIIQLEASRFELELRRAEASLQAARTVLAHAQREFERVKPLYAQKAISTQQHDDLRHAVERAQDEMALATVARDTARRNLADTRITAPFAGSVDTLAVDVGDFVAPGTRLATLVDLSRVRIFAGVTAQEAARLEPDSPARVSVPDLGGQTFDVTLKSISRVAQASDGTYPIELWMDAVDARMFDGLVVQVELPAADATPRLLARRAALLRRAGQPEVFVVVEEAGVPTARVRRLRTGRSQGEWVEILAGLEEGEEVVWDGHFALEDGSQVEVDGGALDAAGTAERREPPAGSGAFTAGAQDRIASANASALE